MESVVVQDTPLAAYLEGTGEYSETSAAPSPDETLTKPSFAPSKPSMRRARIPQRLLISQQRVSDLRKVGALVLAPTLAKEDNDKFLEHFRYVLIASQLLNERVEASSASHRSSSSDTQNESNRSVTAALSWTGASVTACISFALVYLIRWMRDPSSTSSTTARLIVGVAILLAVTLVASAYLRRQVLRNTRKRAIESANTFVERIQLLESATTSVLTLIQEVEVVSRGYQVSYPLPPVSRLEKPGEPRHCMRMRRKLQTTYDEVISAFAGAVRRLQLLTNEDLGRFLEVYDIHQEDLQEAWTIPNFSPTELGSLKHLRLQQYRFSTLRRLLVCVLLALPATGEGHDRRIWQAAIHEIEWLGSLAISHVRAMNVFVNGEDSAYPATPMSPRMSMTFSTSSGSSNQQRLHAHMRRMNTLSSGIRSIQARIHLLKDESNRAVSASHTESELSNVASSLAHQYEALGSDLNMLLQAWEDGKASLAKGMDRASKRISFGNPSTPQMPPSPAFPPVTSHARSASMGIPLSPPTTEDGSSDAGAEEVFEAVAVPPRKRRSTLSREERIKKIREERAKSASQRESQETGIHMIRELQDVMRMRPQGFRRSMMGAPPQHGQQSPSQKQKPETFGPQRENDRPRQQEAPEQPLLERTQAQQLPMPSAATIPT